MWHFLFPSGHFGLMRIREESPITLRFIFWRPAKPSPVLQTLFQSSYSSTSYKSRNTDNPSPQASLESQFSNFLMNVNNQPTWLTAVDLAAWGRLHGQAGWNDETGSDCHTYWIFFKCFICQSISFDCGRDGKGVKRSSINNKRGL